MTTLLVELRNALDRRWRRDRALRLGTPLALALLCGGAALFRWIEFLGARPVSSTLLECRDTRKNRMRVRTLVFDRGSLEFEIRPTDRLTPIFQRLGAVPHEILDVRRGDAVVLWVGPLGTFTPVPRSPILSTLSAILLLLIAIALRSTRHPRALGTERWMSGLPLDWIESTSREPDGATAHQLRHRYPLRHGLALCAFFFTAFQVIAVIVLGLAAGFLGEQPWFRLSVVMLPLIGASMFPFLPIGWVALARIRFREGTLEINGGSIPVASAREAVVRLHGERLALEIDGRNLLLGPDAILWVAGLLEGRGLPVRLEMD